MKKQYIAAAMICGTLTVGAQNLHKEITVDRTVQPELRESFRLGGITPSILAPEISRTNLRPAEYTSPGTITNEAAQLPPAPWRDSIPHTPYKGYISAGYFPLVNLGLNAGYTFVDNQSTRVEAWTQYCLSNYKGTLINLDDQHRLGIGAFSIGANAAHRINASNDIAIGLKYGHNSVKNVNDFVADNIVEHQDYQQRSNMFTGDIAWRGNFETLRFKTALGFEHFGLGERPSIIGAGHDPARQNIATIAFGAGLADKGAILPWIGADIDWSVVNARGLNVDWRHDYGNGLLPDNKHKYTLGHINPYLRFGENEGLVGHIGFNLSVATGNDNGNVRIAPDIDINWIPSRAVTLYARATGGEYINSQSALFEANPFILNYFAYERSNIAYDIEAGAKLTAPGGFAAHVYGGVASGRDRLTPVIYYNSINVSPFFAPDNIRSWHAGGRLSYTYKYIFSLAAYAEIAGSNKDFATWQYWHDGAKAVTGIDLNVTPIDALDITVKYQIRTKRRAQSMTDVPGTFFAPPVQMELGVVDLHNISDLTINASYRVTERFTAFVNLENLLNRKYLLISGMPAQGIHGLLGVAYKF